MHELWEDNISEEEELAKINIHGKRSPYIEEDCFEKPQDRTAKLNIHLEDPVYTKTVRRELKKCDIHGTAAIAKPLITENNADMPKR
jgi:hypothetical protein